jgi:hypothetical protein
MTPVLVEFLVGLYFVVADSPVLFARPVTIAGVFIIVQGGVVAIRKSNASIFDAFNARMNRVEVAIASPEPSASSGATPSASVKRAEKTVAPSPTPEPSSAQ